MKIFCRLFPAVMLAGIFFVSCSKENLSVTENPVQETFIDGTVLASKTSLCLPGRDFNMHPVIKLSQGADVNVVMLDGEVDLQFFPDEKSGPEGRGYFHVVYESLDLWIDSSVIALNCDHAAAIERTFLFYDSELTKRIAADLNPLKFSTFIARLREDSPSEESVSSKIFYYDEAAGEVRGAFVRSSSISTREDDIVVSQVAEALKTTRRAVPRNELFARAAKYKPCEKVLAVLNEQKVERKTYSYQEAVKNMQKMSYGVNIDELMTVDQSKDPFK